MKILVWSALMLFLLGMAAIGLAESPQAMTPEKLSILITATANGPVVRKIIMELPEPAHTISTRKLTLATASTKRVVSGVYLCDSNGEPVQGPSRLVAIEIDENDEDDMSPGVSVLTGSVFTVNTMMHNVWAERYRVQLRAEALVVDGVEYTLNVVENCIDHRICPDTAAFNYRSAFSGVYVNPYTGEEEEQTLQIAAYEPESLAGGEKNPLIIYLHGQPDGGSDPEIALLSTEVTALAKETIQSYFTAGDQVGAYVLVPQCATYWMDEGDGTNGPGGSASRYTEILMDTINAYLAHNPDVDPDRIYIGGSSNGGYMTLNMLVSYPGIFAAAYPLCEIYSYYLFIRDWYDNYVTTRYSLFLIANRGYTTDDPNPDAVAYSQAAVTGFDGNFYTWSDVSLTEDKLAAIMQTPIWFVSSIDDSTSKPLLYLLPTYRALLQAGAENCHLSLFATKGHYIWRQFFQNEVTGVQDPALLMEGEIPLAGEAELSDYAIQPTNKGGGTLAADGYHNIFAWMNAQSRAAQ